MEPRSLLLSFNRSEANLEIRTVPMSISSDTKSIVRQIPGLGRGFEVLVHDSPDNIDLTRFSGPNGGPLLVLHNDKQLPVGRFFPTDLSDGVLRGYAKFSKSVRGEEVYQDVLDGIIDSTSVTYDYSPDDVKVDKTTRDFPTFYVQRWALIEASLVSIPADTLVGVGRSAATAEEETITVTVTVTETEPTDACPNEGCTPETPCPDCQARCSSEPRSTAAIAASVTPTMASTTGRTEVLMDPILAAAEAANETLQRSQLLSIAKASGRGVEAAEILLSNPNLVEARAAVTALLSTPAPRLQSLEDMGASAKERKEFSYVNLLRADLDRKENKRVENCFELEVSEQIRKSMPTTYQSRGGVFLPFAINARALDSKTAHGAAELVYTVFGGEVIDILRNALKIQALGARYIGGLSSPISFPRQTAAGAAVWAEENAGSDAATSQFSLDTVTLSPKTLIGGTILSRQLLAQNVVNAEAMVRADLAYSILAAVDKKAIDLILSAANVNEVICETGTTRRMATYDDLVEGVAKVAEDNALMQGAGFLTNPQVAASLLTTLEFPTINGSTKIWQGNIEEGVVAGYKALTSNQMSAALGTGHDEMALIFGAFTQILIGGWGAGAEIMTNPYKYDLQGLVQVSSFSMHDVALRHPESFCKFSKVVR